MPKIDEVAPFTDPDQADGAQEEDFKPLTREEAQQWRAGQPRYSPWAVLGWQVLLAVLVAGLIWVISGQTSIAASALYGAAAVILPTAVMVWGVTSSALSRLFAGAAQASLAGFFLWEGVKLLLALAMLWSAPRIVADLNWLALVAGLVVVLKAYWLELWFRARRPQTKL